MTERIKEILKRRANLVLAATEFRTEALARKHTAGCYQVVWKLPQNHLLRLKRFGDVLFFAGYYIYSGSAQQNLIRRIQRHIRKDKNVHWHVDQISCLDIFQPQLVAVYLREKRECDLNREISQDLAAVFPLPGFGSSDCKKGCISHLSYLSCE